MWLLVALVGLAYRRPREWRAPVVLAASGLLALLATVLGVYAIPEYSVPVAPSFVLLAAVALLGARSVAVVHLGLPRGRDDRRRLSATQR
jgi:peptidoglycan/LPS O-acetylase OafA/YrhL